jgi:hypothetical protein
METKYDFNGATFMKVNKITGFSLTLFTFISLAFPNAATSARPVRLSLGQSTTFPTWEGGKSTKLCVNYESGGVGSVKINAGAKQEIVSNKSGKPTCIQRKWGGIRIGVTSQSPGSTIVWTS